MSPEAQTAKKLRLSLANTDWETYAEAISHLTLGWSEGELAHRMAVVIRDTVSPEAVNAAFDAIEGFDATALLSRIRAPTLVIHRRDAPLPGIDAARGLASVIPGARLVVLDGRAMLPFVGDADAVLNAIGEFLREAPGADDRRKLLSGTAIIFFADIADSTALTERLGDDAFRAKARDLDGALRTVIREHAGTPIEGKLLGDGVLAVFTSARQAIEAALACARAGAEATLPLHLGLHAGDVIREENNVYGGAVNIASRISGLSAPGEVLVSDTVRSLARTSAGVQFEDRGEQALKGIGEGVRVWAVQQAEA